MRMLRRLTLIIPGSDPVWMRRNDRRTAETAHRSLHVKFLRGVHLCIDSVLVGEVAFSIIPRIEFFGYEMSKVIFVMAVIFLIDLIFYLGVF